ncbi:hypothetical protein [Streptomyces sp. JJ36]|uniref:hypothetical protein n=1 Tax=Streptomyces sp. JJ36 TaxID=2736645 RepID=UPI001F2A6484|nr:hypothetical protein [Streptomyces sp. JJ36]MCF6523756.1 hypothetical protein [Streptomyces sp. JJ36]
MRGEGLARGPVVRRNTGIGLAAGLLLAGLLFLLPGDDEEPPEADCRPARVTGRQPDPALTGAFARYGNDNTRTDDWTGGDGTRSVRLPGGRTLWLSADTFLDRVHPGGRRVPQPSWVRNSALVMTPDGHLDRTLLGTPAPDGRPAALFPGGATGDGREVWRWPVDAVVEPRSPGAAERVVRVLLWSREAGRPPWVFGVPRATEVATLSLPGLALESIRPVHRPPPGTAPERRVLYGTSAVPAGEWTYVFGADEAGVHGGRASRTYVARAPRGGLADPGVWRHWDGARWTADAAAARPMVVRTAETGGSPEPAPGQAAADPGASGERHGFATNTYTVTRHDGTWLLLSMDAGGPDGRPSQTVVSAWACRPQGPWHGPHRAAAPPLPPGGREAGATAYNPQAHPEFTGADGRLLLGYDVNVTGGTAAVHRDVRLYRPRFLRLTLGPLDGAGARVG